jgi:transcriptional regulator with XRE-family HTH domain
VSDPTPRTIKVTRLKLYMLSVDQRDYEIAAAAGIAPSVLSQYSRGVRDISAKHLISLCNLFDVEPDAIMGWTEVVVA